MKTEAEKSYTVNIVGAPNWYISEHKGQNVEMERPPNVKFTYDQPKDNILTYFINDGLRLADEVESKIKVAYVSENRLVLSGPSTNLHFLEHHDALFDYIIAYDGELIKQFADKCIIGPYCCTFNWPESKQQIYPKNKLCSYITSMKNSTPNQQYRVRLLGAFENIRDRGGQCPDLFGRGHNSLPDSRLGKHLALKDYAFSINIENMIDDHYFSEKIIDCFLCGTIPIYYGAKKLADYFNMDGVIILDPSEDIVPLLNSLSMDLYNQKAEAIQENFILARKYTDTIQYSLNEKLYNAYDKVKNS